MPIRRPDAIDRKILRILQKDATVSLAEISRQVGLSQTPTWKRIRALEASGVILGRVALLSPEAVGLGLTAYVSIESGNHSAEWMERFARGVDGMPEVVEVYRMAGEIDYMLRVVVPDVASYDAFYKRLTALVGLRSVTSRFAMERLKATTVLPIP
jgi:Lrp/AsnC family transcriptional regulator